MGEGDLSTCFEGWIERVRAWDLLLSFEIVISFDTIFIESV